MAYLRGDIYIWDDVSGVHFWNKSGYDSWDLAAWATDETGENRRSGFEEASGVSVPMDVMDAFVMMRLAQIICEGHVEEAIDSATSKFGGNAGAKVLTKNAGAIKKALAGIKLSEPDHTPKR
jgi:hypothetical protein